MWQCEGWVLGRRPLSGGPVDAASLARLVRSLGAVPAAPAAPRPQRRPPALLRCRDDRLELAARHDDEGFESDDDSRSLASDDTAVSNSSSCCFVDDHVYRRGAAVPGAGGKVTGAPPPPRPVPPPGVAGPLASTSSTTSDSANSSGASDTDEADHQPPGPASASAAAGSVAALVQSLSLYQRVAKPPPPPAAAEPEAIPVADVAFCHTDPALPRVAVWVVRRRRPAWASAALDDAASQAPAGLEAIVFETNNERALRKLCNHFQEVSRRLKLDQYRHPHRRKEGAGVPATLGRPPSYPPLAQPSASASPSPSSSYASSSSSSSSPSPSPVAKQTSTSLSCGVSSSSSASTSSSGRSQQRVEPAKASPHQQVFKRLEAPAVVARFNLLQRTDGDGVTHLEVARDTALSEPQQPRGGCSAPGAGGPSSIISLSTPDAPAPPTAAPAPGKPRPILVLGPPQAAELRKVWSPRARPPPSPPPHPPPPQRPERRRFARKSHKAPAPPPPPSPQQQQQQQHHPAATSKADRNKALRGALVSPSSAWPQYSVVRGSAWCAQPQPQPRSRSKSPPRPRRAAAAASASRYAEAARFLGGLSQRLRDAVGGGGGGGHPQQHCSLYATAARRRSTPDVFRSAENLLAGAGGHRLKSVIKKARRPDCRAEPKKVTFSAYATVQVVD